MYSPCFSPKGVYLSSTADLKGKYGEAFESFSHVLCLPTPQEIAGRSEIRFELYWRLADNAFAPYPNIGMVSSIGEGVDNILSCPSLPENVIITRLCDPDQAYLYDGCIFKMADHLISQQHETIFCQCDQSRLAWS
jgi:glyoxylate/hydroxypyruvate reductase